MLRVANIIRLSFDSIEVAFSAYVLTQNQVSLATRLACISFVVSRLLVRCLR